MEHVIAFFNRSPEDLLLIFVVFFLIIITFTVWLAYKHLTVMREMVWLKDNILLLYSLKHNKYSSSAHEKKLLKAFRDTPFFWLKKDNSAERLLELTKEAFYISFLRSFIDIYSDPIISKRHQKFISQVQDIERVCNEISFDVDPGIFLGTDHPVRKKHDELIVVFNHYLNESTQKDLEYLLFSDDSITLCKKLGLIKNDQQITDLHVHLNTLKKELS